MKKTFRILIVLVALTTMIVSCAKEPTIVGRWKVKKVRIENQLVANMMMGYTQQAEGRIFEFKPDGTVTADDAEVDGASGEMRYAISGENNITLTIDMKVDMDTIAIDTTITMSGTYELPDKTTLKMGLSLPLQQNKDRLKEIWFNIEAERQK